MTACLRYFLHGGELRFRATSANIHRNEVIIESGYPSEIDGNSIITLVCLFLPVQT